MLIDTIHAKRERCAILFASSRILKRDNSIERKLHEEHYRFDSIGFHHRLVADEQVAKTDPNVIEFSLWLVDVDGDHACLIASFPDLEAASKAGRRLRSSFHKTIDR